MNNEFLQSNQILFHPGYTPTHNYSIPPPKFKRVIIIGIHGWDLFPTVSKYIYKEEHRVHSRKFCMKCKYALKKWWKEEFRTSMESVEIHMCPLEGFGTILQRVNKFKKILLDKPKKYKKKQNDNLDLNLQISKLHHEQFENVEKSTEKNEKLKHEIDWITHHQEEDYDPCWSDIISSADLVLVACHSQGAAVAMILLDELMKHPYKSEEDRIIDPQKQVIGVISIAGLHHGTSYKAGSIVQWGLNNLAQLRDTKELFSLGNTDSLIFKRYLSCACRVLSCGVRMACIASYYDALVDLSSSLADIIECPLILRALYVHDSAKEDQFFVELVMLCIKLRNKHYFEYDLLRSISFFHTENVTNKAHSLIHNEVDVYILGIDWILKNRMIQNSFSNRQEVIVRDTSKQVPKTKEEHLKHLQDTLSTIKRKNLMQPEFKRLSKLFISWAPISPEKVELKNALSTILTPISNL